MLTGSSNNVVRYNISQNDLTHTFNFAGGVTPDTQIYNNTIYIGTGQNTKIIDHEWDDAGNINAPYTFRNNLVYNLGQGGYNLPGVNGSFDHNLLYGNHPVSEPENMNPVTANPLLVAQGSGGIGWNTVGGYKLREGSLHLVLVLLLQIMAVGTIGEMLFQQKIHRISEPIMDPDLILPHCLKHL